MIAKLVKGKGFRGALEYDLREQKGQLLDTNMGSDNPRDLAREFGEIRALRPNLTKAVCHVSLSVAHDEKLTDEQWKGAAQKYLTGMGFQDSQFVVSKHTDTEHPHIHIIANRVTMKGEVVSDSKDYQRQEAIMRKLEKEYGLKEVQPSQEALRRAPTKGEIECAVRTGRPSAKVTMQELVDKALLEKTDFETFRNHLEKKGVEVMLNQSDTGRVSGISYRHNEITMKGSDLGRGYSWSGIQKRGLTYEQSRHIEISSGRSEPERGTTAGREYGTRVGKPDGKSTSVARTENRERGAISSLVEAIGRVHADIDRYDKPEHDSRRNFDGGAQERFSPQTQRGGENMVERNTKRQYGPGATTGGKKDMEHSNAGNAGDSTDDLRQRTENANSGGCGEMDIPNRGQLAGVDDIQRIAALANARSQQIGRTTSPNLLEAGRFGEKDDSPESEPEKITNNEKEIKRRGDDLEL